MPRSHFYWEMSVGAAERTGNGESTYSAHSEQEGKGCGAAGPR